MKRPQLPKKVQRKYAGARIVVLKHRWFGCMDTANVQTVGLMSKNAARVKLARGISY